MRDEIKTVCNDIIEENKIFDYMDAVSFSLNYVKDLDLIVEELTEAMLYVIIGMDCEQEGVC